MSCLNFGQPRKLWTAGLHQSPKWGMLADSCGEHISKAGTQSVDRGMVISLGRRPDCCRTDARVFPNFEPHFTERFVAQCSGSSRALQFQHSFNI